MTATAPGHAEAGPHAPADAFPVLTDSQLDRLRAYGTAHEVAVGEVVLRAGDTSYDLVLIDEGAVEIERAATRDAPADVIARHGAGRFLGEMNLLTGLRPDHLGPAWQALGREPLPFETIIHGVFAAGDVRRGSMKRVAAAVGEGASAIRSVHVAIGPPA